MGRIIQIAASEGHLYALTEDGIVYEWDYPSNKWEMLGG